MTLPDRLLTIPPVDRDELVLRGPDLEQELGRWVAAVPLEMDHAATATITVSLVEQEPGELLKEMAGFFRRDPKTGVRRLKRWNVLRLHDTNYILAVMRRTAAGIDLDFYDEASEDLKRYTGPLKWARNRFTRAQGIKGLANEAGVLSYIPDQNTKQPVADLPKKDQEDLKVGRLDRFNRVYPAHFLEQSAGHVQLTPSQVRAIAESVGLPGLAFEQIAKGESTYYPGIVQHDPGDGNVGYGLWQITPHAWNGDKRLLGKLKDLGGIDAMRNPLRCAAMAKFMFDISGLSPWTTSKYLSLEARTEAARAPRGSTPSSNDGVVDRAHVERFEFTIGARENYWDAIDRFAGDVRWRRFTAFNHLVYASDFTLADIRPYELDLDNGWIDDPGDWVVSRDEAIDELPISGRLAAIVPPGTAFAISADDPLYGTWLARNFKRDLLDQDAHVDLTLGRPVAPLPEPASTVVRRARRDPGDTTTTVSAGGGLSAIGKNWTARAIIDRIVVPVAARHGARSGLGTPQTPENVAAANRAHSHLGSASDHYGIYENNGRDKYADDCSIGADIRGGYNAAGAKIGDALAKELAELFQISWSGSGLISAIHNGWRFQLIWRYEDPQAGNHYTHVHFGAKRA